MGGTHGDACEQCLVGLRASGHQWLNADSMNSKQAISARLEGAACPSSDFFMSVSVGRFGSHDDIDDCTQGTSIHMGRTLW